MLDGGLSLHRLSLDLACTIRSGLAHDFVRDIVLRLRKLANGLAESAGELGQLAGSEKQQQNEKDQHALRTHKICEEECIHDDL